MIPYVDTHCHVDLFPAPTEIVDESERNCIYTIAVTNAPSLFENTARLTLHREYTRPAVGLHPQLVRTHAGELDLMWPALERTRYVGEVGLDYTSPDATDHACQRTVFRTILERCAGYGNKIITIHSRRAARDVITAVERSYPGRLILHWFSGSLSELDQALSKGFLFSVNSVMCGSKKGADIISRIPQDRILTESDGPFVKHYGQPACPGDVVSVIGTLAGLWDVTEEAARETVFDNFRRLCESAMPSPCNPS